MSSRQLSFASGFVDMRTLVLVPAVAREMMCNDAENVGDDRCGSR